MKDIVHRIAAALGALAVMFPATDMASMPVWLKIIVAGFGGITLFFTEADKALSLRQPPPAGGAGAVPGKMLGLALLVMVGAGACHPTPQPGQPGTAVNPISCATKAVQQCAPSALPGVNGCLSGQGDVTTCILGLIQPAGCITYEVVACLTQHEGSAADAAAKANPDDARDALRAARAREFIEKTGARFSP